MKIVGLIFGILIVFLAIVGVTMYITYSNKYVALNSAYEAQVSNDKIVYDEVWKVIKQQAGVSEKYSDDFRKNYTSIMQSRNYGGEMMKWITESNPNFTPDLYAKLMNSIEVQRSKFTENQRKLISIHQELRNLLLMFPSSLFLSGKTLPDISASLVTSTQTEEVFNTGKDDSVKVFQ